MKTEGISQVVAWAGVVVVVLGGCGGSATQPPQVNQAAIDTYLSDKPAAMHGMFERVVAEGERNRVLNLVRAALTAMEFGHSELAAQTFDEALVTIETIYGGDANAAAARSTFTAEDRKTFRGEPYERAMAFYYRGILYLMEGDYENARASFKSGILQDTLAEQEQYRQDFALLEFLEGWSSQCNGNGDLASEAYEMAKTHNSEAALPAPGDNVLVLADFGHAPVKVATGEHNHLLTIAKNDAEFTPVRTFQLNAEAQSLVNEESILWQAQTRGGREFDAILEGKAQFKEGAETVAEVSGAVAQAGVTAATTGLLTGNDDMAQVGGTMAIAGGVAALIASTTAQATRPQADTRQWNNLPERVLYGTYRVDGVVDIAGIPGRWHMGGDDRCSVAWARAPATDMAAIGATVAGKVFVGEADYGPHGIHPYKVSFYPAGEALVEWGEGSSLFCMSCGSLQAVWVDGGGSITLKYAQWPNIDTTGSLTLRDGILAGGLVNNNGYSGETTHATISLREQANDS